MTLGELSRLMDLMRAHGAIVVRTGDTEVHLGAAPPLPILNGATVAHALHPELAAAVAESLATPEEDEPTPAEQAEAEAFRLWQRGGSALG